MFTSSSSSLNRSRWLNHRLLVQNTGTTEGGNISLVHASSTVHKHVVLLILNYTYSVVLLMLVHVDKEIQMGYQEAVEVVTAE